MRSAIVFVAFLTCCGTLLGDQTTPSASARRPSSLLDDLVQLTRSGSSDAEVLAYAQAHRRELPPEVSDRDLNYLRASGVSARVVSYMYAIDIRLPEEQPEKGVGTDSREDSVPLRASYPANPYPQDEDVPYGNGDVNGYVSNYPDSYASSPYGYSGYCDPYYNFGCSYPYPSYYASPFYYAPWPFFGQHFHDHHGHGHGHVGHHGHDGGHPPGHQGTMVARSDRREVWRERGSNPSSRRSVVVGPRGSERSLPARQTVGPRPGVTGRMAGPRGGIRPVNPARGGAGGFRGPQPNFGRRGGVSGPSLSGGGMRGFSGGGMRGTGRGSSAPSGRH